MMDKLLRVFYTDGPRRRLRSGWRLGIYVLLLMLFTLPFTLMAGLLMLRLNMDPASTPALLVGQIAFAIASTLATWFAVRFLDQRPWVSIGLTGPRSRASREFGLGLSLGVGQFALILLVALALGWARILACRACAWTWDQALRELVYALALWTAVAWSEELILRGYVFQTLAEGIGTFWAWVAQALIFAILHAANPGWGPRPALGLFLAGLYLGQGYLATRRLWLPIGLHWGWNWAEAALGFPVSGLEQTPMRLFDLAVSGPEAWTGGTFGPEGGYLGVLAILVGMMVLHQWAARQARTNPPRDPKQDPDPRIEPR
ncbi:MAG: CPBP family intramembrane metalloprotease [Chloroflexi bacterium]|nr:CPBP family intramembrane metalloprotease [Chloroflexota bacterium]